MNAAVNVQVDHISQELAPRKEATLYQASAFGQGLFALVVYDAAAYLIIGALEPKGTGVTRLA